MLVFSPQDSTRILLGLSIRISYGSMGFSNRISSDSTGIFLLGFSKILMGFPCILMDSLPSLFSTSQHDIRLPTYLLWRFDTFLQEIRCLCFFEISGDHCVFLISADFA